MKLSKISQNAKLRNLSVLCVLMLSIGFIIYNFGTTLKDVDALVKAPFIKTLTTNENMSVQSSSIDSFWGDCNSINVETNIPKDVLARAGKLVLTEKTVSVDVSIINSLCCHNQNWTQLFLAL